MAIVGTSFNWVPVTGGVRTRLWQGPLVVFFPLQGLEMFKRKGGPSTITWTLDVYSAAPPFYAHNMGSYTDTSVGLGATEAPVGHSPFYTVAFLTFTSSPWVEFWILTDNACTAHISAF